MSKFTLLAAAAAVVIAPFSSIGLAAAADVNGPQIAEAFGTRPIIVMRVNPGRNVVVTSTRSQTISRRHNRTITVVALASDPEERILAVSIVGTARKYCRTPGRAVTTYEYYHFRPRRSDTKFQNAGHTRAYAIRTIRPTQFFCRDGTTPVRIVFSLIAKTTNGARVQSFTRRLTITAFFPASGRS